MNYKLLNFAIFLLSVSLLLSCQEEEQEPIAQTFPVSFGFNLNESQPTSRTKSDASTLVLKALITITKADGSPTQYTKSELEIFESNGVLYSDELYLEKGKNIITKLRLVDGEGTTLFAIPEDMDYQKHVNETLPIAFEVDESSTTKTIMLDVISTFGLTPEDFGYDPDEIQFEELNYFWIILKDKYFENVNVTGELRFLWDGPKVKIDSLTKVFYKEEYGKTGSAYTQYSMSITSYRYDFKYIYFDHLQLQSYKERPLIITLEKIPAQGNTYSGDITLRNQKEVNALASKKLDYIHGDLIIEQDLSSVKDPITDLGKISTLLEINGNLIIKNNPLLVSTDSMILNHVHGNLIIENNPKLSNLDGFKECTRIDGKIEITNNVSLTSLCGITPVLRRFRSTLTIEGNGHNPSIDDFSEGRCSLNN